MVEEDVGVVPGPGQLISRWTDNKCDPGFNRDRAESSWVSYPIAKPCDLDQPASRGS